VICRGHVGVCGVHRRLRRDSFGGRVLKKVCKMEENRFSENLEESAATKSSDLLANSVKADNVV
jgi:hypothetical protein